MTPLGYVTRLVLYYGFARHLPDSTVPGGTIFRRIRYCVSKSLFERCEENVNVEHGAFFGRGRTISVGLNSGIGINASIGPGTRIGSNVMMARDVLILTENHRTSCTDVPMIEQGNEPVSPVHIGDDVWIGARAIILPGVRIGSGSIVGAGAVVSRDVPDGAVVVGNPARIVHYRKGEIRKTEPNRELA